MPSASGSADNGRLAVSGTNAQITKTFSPTVLEIRNDSSKHAHHAPMRAINGGAGETRKSAPTGKDGD
jgi:stress-induced morphogen